MGVTSIFKKFEWIGEFSPVFRMKAKQIVLLNGPTEFLSCISDKIASSQFRVVLTALYLGNGAIEAKLIKTLEGALERASSNPEYRVKFLLDHSRGTRGPNCSCQMLQPLLSSSKFQLFLFHTPKLRGLLRRILPSRWNEVIGVQHMKIGIFDDSVLLTGANLSDSYFTNRQDRYILIENCKSLADFYEELVDVVNKNSFKVAVAEESGWATEAPAVHPYEDSYGAFASEFKSDLRRTISKWRQFQSTETYPKDNALDTLIYPLIQAGFAGINDEDTVLKRAFASCGDEPQERICLASAYFNLTAGLSDLILRAVKAQFTLLYASPQANGFFNGAGISGYVPAMYAYVSHCFFKERNELKEAGRIGMFEYIRNGWTFHGKGIWWTLADSAKPSATFLGSSNFGHRSIHRDLETQIVLLTADDKLQESLAEEKERLFSSSEEVSVATFEDSTHRYPFWIPIVSKWIRKFF